MGPSLGGRRSISSGNTTASDEREALADVTFDSEEEIDRENIEIGGVDPTLQEAEREQQHPRDGYDLRVNTKPPERYGDQMHSLRDVSTGREPNLDPKPYQGQKEEQEKEHKRGNSKSPLISRIAKVIRWVKGHDQRPTNSQ